MPFYVRIYVNSQVLFAHICAANIKGKNGWESDPSAVLLLLLLSQLIIFIAWIFMTWTQRIDPIRQRVHGRLFSRQSIRLLLLLDQFSSAQGGKKEDLVAWGEGFNKRDNRTRHTNSNLIELISMETVVVVLLLFLGIVTHWLIIPLDYSALSTLIRSSSSLTASVLVWAFHWF